MSPVCLHVVPVSHTCVQYQYAIHVTIMFTRAHRYAIPVSHTCMQHKYAIPVHTCKRRLRLHICISHAARLANWPNARQDCQSNIWLNAHDILTLSTISPRSLHIYVDVTNSVEPPALAPGSYPWIWPNTLLTSSYLYSLTTVRAFSFQSSQLCVDIFFRE